MANNTVNSVMIQIPNAETTEFQYNSNRGWSRTVTTTEITEEGKEVSSTTSACSAEDVIVALLLNMSRDGVLIAAGKRPYGTPILTQSWLPRDAYRLCADSNDRYQPYLESNVPINTLSELVKESGIGIEIA